MIKKINLEISEKLVELIEYEMSMNILKTEIIELLLENKMTEYVSNKPQIKVNWDKLYKNMK